MVNEQATIEYAGFLKGKILGMNSETALKISKSLHSLLPVEATEDDVQNFWLQFNQLQLLELCSVFKVNDEDLERILSSQVVEEILENTHILSRIWSIFRPYIAPNYPLVKSLYSEIRGKRSGNPIDKEVLGELFRKCDLFNPIKPNYDVEVIESGIDSVLFNYFLKQIPEIELDVVKGKMIPYFEAEKKASSILNEHGESNSLELCLAALLLMRGKNHFLFPVKHIRNVIETCDRLANELKSNAIGEVLRHYGISTEIGRAFKFLENYRIQELETGQEWQFARKGYLILQRLYQKCCANPGRGFRVGSLGLNQPVTTQMREVYGRDPHRKLFVDKYLTCINSDEWKFNIL